MAVFPDPPFFYKLFDDTTSAVYQELNNPPIIPEKRILFDEEETDNVPNDSIDEKKDNIMNELQELNNNLLSSFIEVLYIIKQPEYYLVELKKQKEQNNKSLIQNEDILNDNKMDEVPMIFEPSQLTPLINDKCESLKIIFRSMRDILNNLRPHQSKQIIIQTLRKQLLYKQNKLKLINENIINGKNICKQSLNVKKDNEHQSDHENDLFFISSMDNNHTQESIQRLKQTLDQSFYQ